MGETDDGVARRLNLLNHSRACGQGPRFRVTKGTWKQSVGACLRQAFGGMNRALQARLRDTMPPTAFPQKEFVRQPTASQQPLSHAPKRHALKN